MLIKCICKHDISDVPSKSNHINLYYWGKLILEHQSAYTLKAVCLGSAKLSRVSASADDHYVYM